MHANRKRESTRRKDNSTQICADEEVGIAAKRPAGFRLTPDYSGEDGGQAAKSTKKVLLLCNLDGDCRTQLLHGPSKPYPAAIL
jgi:hypothetical protein